MEIQIVPYNPEWHNQLLGYMQSVFPHRNLNYLEWWITNIDLSKDCWEKCLLIINDSNIIGCTTVNQTAIINNNNINFFFFRGNTIISQDQRGKGISKEIYNRVNSYNNWLSVGITDIAWNIQPKYVTNFTPLHPINVYISLNIYIIKQLIKKFFHRELTYSSFPFSMSVGSHEKIVKVKDVNQMDIPQNGKWSSDEIELVRDIDFFRKRFFDIYCSEKYVIYQYISNDRLIGYVVLRGIIYKGLDMVSLVDYRFFSRADEPKAFKAASKFAKHFGIGLVLTLTSRKYTFNLSPLTIMMKKKLNCATGMKQYLEKFNDMLITSADSDLDFVYYK